MNLIERARAATEAKAFVWCDIAALLQELAGEVERCWAEIEQLALNAVAVQAQLDLRDQALAERDAEIERLKNATDHAALDQAWVQGYLRAVQHSTPIIHNLLKAAASAPSEDHHHG